MNSQDVGQGLGGKRPPCAVGGQLGIHYLHRGPEITCVSLTIPAIGIDSSSSARPSDWTMPLQPRPIADTSSPRLPGLPSRKVETPIHWRVLDVERNTSFGHSAPWSIHARRRTTSCDLNAGNLSRRALGGISESGTLPDT